MRIEKWLHNKCEENRSPILNSLFIYPAFLNSQSPIYQVFENSIARYLEKHGHPYIQLKAVLFDMDGVLFNSMPYHADAWHKVMERHGLHLSREEAYMHEGRTGASTINIVYQRQYGKDATPEMIESIYAEKSAEFSTHPEPERMPGAWEVLQKVKAAGLIPVLVTGSGQHSLPFLFALIFALSYSQTRTIMLSSLLRRRLLVDVPRKVNNASRCFLFACGHHIT